MIGLFSGSDIPPSLSTDTGLMRLRFTSDGSVQVRLLSVRSFVVSMLHTCAADEKQKVSGAIIGCWLSKEVVCYL